MPTTIAAPSQDAASPPVRLRLRGQVDAATEKLALRAALTAAHLLGLATGRLLRDLRSLNDPLAEALAQLKEADLRARLAGTSSTSSAPASTRSPTGTAPT